MHISQIKNEKRKVFFVKYVLLRTMSASEAYDWDDSDEIVAQRALELGSTMGKYDHREEVAAGSVPSLPRASVPALPAGL